MPRPFARTALLLGTLIAIPLLTIGVAPVAARGRTAATGVSAITMSATSGTQASNRTTTTLSLQSRPSVAPATDLSGAPSSAAAPSARGGTAAPAASVAPAAATTPAAPSPSRVERRPLVSAILGREIYYYVYLPQGYDNDPAVRYPVVYLLHGIGGNADEWLAYGAREAANSLMNGGEIRPYIIAFPHGEQGYFVDQVGGPQWATYVANDLVPEIDKQYRTLADRANRAIGGLSMGAHGALQIALNHPDVFSIVGAHSPSFRPRAEVPAYFGDDAQFALRDPTQLVAAHPDSARTLTIWLDYGLQDGFRAGQLLFEQALIDNDIPHTLHERVGDHSYIYWNAHLLEYLRFYSAAFTPFVFGAGSIRLRHSPHQSASIAPLPASSNTTLA